MIFDFIVSGYLDTSKITLTLELSQYNNLHKKTQISKDNYIEGKLEKYKKYICKIWEGSYNGSISFEGIIEDFDTDAAQVLSVLKAIAIEYKS